MLPVKRNYNHNWPIYPSSIIQSAPVDLVFMFFGLWQERSVTWQEHANTPEGPIRIQTHDLLVTNVLIMTLPCIPSISAEKQDVLSVTV